MRSALLVVLAVLALGACAADLEAFRMWAAKHGKVYTKQEEPRRLMVWASNMRAIRRLNAENPTATFGLNKFADLTESEFSSIHNGLRAPTPNADIDVIPDDVSGSADVRARLPAVKNQGSCGSCYAFSAVANMEGRVFTRNGGKVVSLSEQQITSCDNNPSTGYPYGCNGGLMTQADQYVIDAGGIWSEADYPYKGLDGDRSKCTNIKAAAKFDDFINWGIINNDTHFIEVFEEYGPLSIGVEAGLIWQTYTGGVIDNKRRCGHNPNHGVTLVGYGTDEKTQLKYWLIRNSWGEDWGEDGYVRISRGKNMCGINTMISSIA